LAVDIPLTGASGINAYLDTLVSQGFNAVMMNVVEHHYTLVKSPKERTGLLPFTQRLDGTTYTGSPNGTTGAAGTQGQFASDNYSSISTQCPDWTFINNSYWQNVEVILDACLAHNILVFPWVAYLGFHVNDEGWLTEMVVIDAVTGAGGFTGFSFANPTKSKLWNYGAWLASRWKNYPNLIWTMGGDYGSGGQSLSTPQQNAVNNVMDGMKSVAGQQSTLFTAHWDRPCISTDTVLSAGNFDLNLCYADDSTAELARRGYAHTPAIPTFLGEYFYEGSLFGGSTPFRRYLYWAVLSGIAGCFYGHEQLWRFDNGSPGTDYTTLLSTTARNDAVRQFALWKSKPWHRLKPSGLGGMGTIVTAGGGTASPQSTDFVAAACTSEGDLLLAYVPPAHSGTITVDMTKLAGTATARWFDPTNASFTAIGTFSNTGTRAFTTPGTNSAGQTDFLLVIETSAGAAAGTSTAAAVGQSLDTGTGSAAGSSTAAATGQALATGTGTSAGTSTAAATSGGVTSGTGTAAGSSTAAAVGAALGVATGSAAGTSTAAAVGGSRATGTGSASGSSGAAAVGAELATGTGSSAGSSTALGAPPGASAGSATGAGGGAGVGSALVKGAGASAGTSTATGSSASPATEPTGFAALVADMDRIVIDLLG